MKYCNTCHFPRPPFCHHCSVCNKCVLNFDHHCVFTGNCVGLWNYRSFCVFCATIAAYGIFTGVQMMISVGRDLAFHQFRVFSLQTLCQALGIFLTSYSTQKAIRILRRTIRRNKAKYYYFMNKLIDDLMWQGQIKLFRLTQEELNDEVLNQCKYPEWTRQLVWADVVNLREQPSERSAPQ